ncbi:MAG: hypothetical protein AAF721_24580 [Myxococcota bacterium]
MSRSRRVHRRSLGCVLSTLLAVGCGAGSGGDGDASSTADSGGTSGHNTTDDSGSPGGGAGESAADSTATGADGGTGSTSGTPPPSEPGVHSTLVADLPGGEPTACEWEWTIRTLHYHPSAVVPRRMYHAGCDVGPDARMVTSITLGENAEHPDEDPSSGALIVSAMDNATGTLSRIDQRHFPECISMHGVAVSDDCSVIGALCRIPSGTAGFDKDVLATHAAADWMTNPYECGDRGVNDEMWLYEWTDGDLQSEPRKFIVHKSIGSWEYGNNYLRLGNDAAHWGIAMKTTVGGEDGPRTCHEADAFLVMDRGSETMTDRGWSWACGTGHTTFNRLAHNPATDRYAMMCSTDYNEAQTGGLGAYVFRMEDGDAQEFHYANLDGIKNKGGASSIVPRPDGGYVGVLVGVEGTAVPDGYPDEPGTGIGLARWNADGAMEGDIRWIRQDPEGYLSYATLSELAPGRYLLGWGVMQRLADLDDGDQAMRVPWEFWLMEVDDAGEPLTDPYPVEGAGWGELDEMVPLGLGRAGWAYIADPALTADAQSPACNQPEIQLSVYTSPLG